MPIKFRPDSIRPKVAYLSMGAYLESYMPTYSGGLEILSGDLLRTCADLEIPAVGFIQASHNGFYRQRFDGNNRQYEEPVFWDPKSTLQRLDTSVVIRHRNRDLRIGAEVFPVVGQTGFVVPVYLLDSNFEDNYHDEHEDDRQLTSRLYSDEHRIAQENILGQGSVRLARELGYMDIETFHMNEGHACFAPLQLLAENGFSDSDVRSMCVFTTHTPVCAGHDVFSYDEVRGVVGPEFIPWHIQRLAGEYDFNTTRLAANMSRYINAVARTHHGICGDMDVFNERDIDYITNGVHLKTWASLPMAELYDAHIPGWRQDPSVLESVSSIPMDALFRAKDMAKRRLICYVNAKSPVKFRQDVLTVVWARRFTAYKRPQLIFEDVERLEEIAGRHGGIQIIFTGKPHPRDEVGKNLLHQVIEHLRLSNGRLQITFLPGYSARLSKRLLGGADIWLNTPRRPNEASGTSGMKACLNGGVNLSVCDGWWAEGLEINPNAGWTIGKKTICRLDGDDPACVDREDSESLYDNLEDALKTYYGNHGAWGQRMKASVSLAAHFNTHRMVRQYASRAWNIEV